jgi:hypothetical protein
VESGGFQKGEKEGGQEENRNRRPGNDEKRGKDCGCNTTGGAAANAATSGKDDGATRTEKRRCCNEDRTGAGIEDGQAPPHTANVCGDPHAQRGSKTTYAKVIATASRSIPPRRSASSR